MVKIPTKKMIKDFIHKKDMQIAPKMINKLVNLNASDSMTKGYLTILSGIARHRDAKRITKKDWELYTGIKEK